MVALGCAVRPEAVLDGILKAVEVLEEKHRAFRAGKTDKKEVPA
jgi:Ni,Fe-hydrogenase III small subunit